jgi:hypothetical protein
MPLRLDNARALPTTAATTTTTAAAAAELQVAIQG